MQRVAGLQDRCLFAHRCPGSDRPTKLFYHLTAAIARRSRIYLVFMSGPAQAVSCEGRRTF
jgi:hypothetical protein